MRDCLGSSEGDPFDRGQYGQSRLYPDVLSRSQEKGTPYSPERRWHVSSNEERTLADKSKQKSQAVVINQ